MPTTRKHQVNTPPGNGHGTWWNPKQLYQRDTCVIECNGTVPSTQRPQNPPIVHPDTDAGYPISLIWQSRFVRMFQEIEGAQ